MTTRTVLRAPVPHAVVLALALALALALPAATLGAWNVLDYGARGDGTTDDTAAIARAYTACRGGGGGGTVVFPSGHVFRTGPFDLTCNNSVTSIEHGALVQSLNTTDTWPFGPDCPEPAQGRTPRQMAPLMHVRGGSNITVTGGGVRRASFSTTTARTCALRRSTPAHLVAREPCCRARRA